MWLKEAKLEAPQEGTDRRDNPWVGPKSTRQTVMRDLQGGRSSSPHTNDVIAEIHTLEVVSPTLSLITEPTAA